MKKCNYTCNSNLKNLKPFCGKKMLSAALGFEPRSFDCRESQRSRKRLFFTERFQIL